MIPRSSVPRSCLRLEESRGRRSLGCPEVEDRIAGILFPRESREAAMQREHFRSCLECRGQLLQILDFFAWCRVQRSGYQTIAGPR